MSLNIIRMSGSPEGFGEKPDELSQEMFSSSLPVQHSHSYFEDESIGLYVGVWDTTDMVETSGPYPCEEYMVLIEGCAEIENAESRSVDTVIANEGFLIPKGYNCQWHQKGYLRKFYVIYENENAVNTTDSYDGITKIKNNLNASNERLYQNGDQSFIVGTYYNEENGTFVEESNKHKFIYQRSGSIDICEQGQLPYTVKAGEAFFVPAGTSYQWRSSGAVVQDYVEINAQ